MNESYICPWNIEDTFSYSYRCRIGDEYKESPLVVPNAKHAPLSINTTILLFILTYGWNIISYYTYLYVRRCSWLTISNTPIHQKTIADISKNIVHFINAFVCVATMHPSILYVHDNQDAFHRQVVNLGILSSVAFYLYDTVRLFQRFQTANIAYIVHHITTVSWLYYAWIDYHRQLILYAVYLLEYSNFMLYVSYHILKAYPTHKLLQTVSECFQFVWYGYFRTIRLTIHLIAVRGVLFTEVFQSVPMFVMFGILYVMGLYWTYKLYCKCVRLLSVSSKPL